jgi:hypothetical protein
MSDNLLDTEQFGKASVEAGQAYTAMPDPREMQERANEQAAVERLAQQIDTEVAEPGTGVNTPFPIEYHKVSADGIRSDERSPDNQTLEVDRAAKDLADYRRGMEDIQRALRDQQLAAEVDALRGAEAAQPQQAQQPAEPQPPPQLEGVPQEENDWLVKQFQAEPRLLETFRAYQHQTEQQVAQAQAQAVQHAEATQRQYVDALASYATAASATIFQAFPELNGLTADQMPAVIQAIGKQNPERAMQMSNHIQNVQLLSAKAREAQTAQARQYQAAQQHQFQAWSRGEDDAYSEATKTDTPQRTAAIKERPQRSANFLGNITTIR